MELSPHEIIVPDPSSYELTANHPDDISSMSDIPNLSSKLCMIQEQKEPFRGNIPPTIPFSSEDVANTNSIKHLNNTFNTNKSRRKSKMIDPLNQTNTFNQNEHLSKRLKENSSNGGKALKDEGDEGIHENKDDIYETFRKKKELIDKNESEKNSVSSTTLISSKKFLKNTILLEYVPKAFEYLKYCLMASVFFIYLSQVLNVVFITAAYNELQENFINDFQYDELTPFLFRIVRSSYKLCLLDSEIEKENLSDLVNKKKINK
jgi:hypothetical protein